MKQNLYKIIVAASVLLGVLGPQVASGKVETFSSAPQKTEYSSQLVVVEQDNQSVDIEVASSQGATCVADSSLRLDLLLWQGGCNTLAIAPKISQPKIVIVNQPQNLPKLAIEDKINFTKSVSVNPAPLGQNQILLASVFSFKQETSKISHPINLIRIAYVVNDKTNKVENISTVVMRC